MIPSIDILGLPYKIVSVDGLKDDAGNPRDAQITYHNTLIEISTDMSPLIERQTLLHEALHAMLKAQGQLDYQHDESLIEAVSNGVLYLLRHNPALVQYLCEDVK